MQENWGGVVTSKNRKRSSYLTKNSEWLHIDLQQKASVVPIGILRNGNCSSLKPIKIDKQNIILSNTCAFDSFLQIWCCSYCDNTKFEKTESSNGYLSKLTTQMIKQIGAKAYYFRCLILLKLFPKIEHLPNGISHITTECTIESLIRKLCSGGELYHSYVETIRCQKCYHTRMLPISVVPLTIMSTESVNELQGSLDTYFSERNHRKICVKPNCNGHASSKLDHNNMYIFIEITVETRIPLVKLNDIPSKVKVNNLIYKLAGLVAYSGPSESVNHKVIGHFTAYCLRINDKLELCI